LFSGHCPRIRQDSVRFLPGPPPDQSVGRAGLSPRKTRAALLVTTGTTETSCSTRARARRGVRTLSASTLPALRAGSACLPFGSTTSGLLATLQYDERRPLLRTPGYTGWRSRGKRQPRDAALRGLWTARCRSSAAKFADCSPKSTRLTLLPEVASRDRHKPRSPLSGSTLRRASASSPRTMAARTCSCISAASRRSGTSPPWAEDASQRCGAGRSSPVAVSGGG